MGIWLEESYSNSWSLKTIHCNKSWTTIWQMPRRRYLGTNLHIFKFRETWYQEAIVLNPEQSKKKNAANLSLFKVSLLICDSVQFSSVIQSCPTLCDPMNSSTPGLLVHNQLPEFTQTHIHRVSDAIQPSHPLSSPSPPAPNPSQHQSLFQWVNSSHQVAKVLEFQL